MSKFFTATILLLSIVIAAVSYTRKNPFFESLSASEMYQTIISQKDHAIQKAKAEGDYHYCIEPPCTMCYMEANEWNNQTAGTCACDDLIAQGQEPCPQCKGGLCSGEQESVCAVEN